MPRILVIGCGSIGKRHIRNLLSLNADVIAFDVQAERRDEVHKTFDIPTVDDIDAAWGFKCTAALITVPTSLHLPLALEAAKRGLDLFIEKPIADRLDGLSDLLETVNNRKLVTLVGCNLRFHPGLIAVKRLCEDGGIGKVISARVEFGHYLPDWHPREDYRKGYSARRTLGGGVIFDAIHELDYITWILGEVAAVACFAGKNSGLEIDTEDCASILLKFKAGSVAEVHLDYIQRAYSRTCQLIGEEGTIHWNYVRGEVLHYSAAERDWRTITNLAAWDPNDMYFAEMKHFLTCLRSRENPMQDVFQGARVLKVALAAHKASDTDTVVKL